VGLNKNDIGRMKMKLGEMGSKIASCKLGRLIAEKLILRYVNCCVDFEHLEFGVEEAKGKFIVNIDAHVKLNENDLRNLIVQNIYRN
jgi:hypothetical protein